MSTLNQALSTQFQRLLYRPQTTCLSSLVVFKMPPGCNSILALSLTTFRSQSRFWLVISRHLLICKPILKLPSNEPHAPVKSCYVMCRAARHLLQPVESSPLKFTGLQEAHLVLTYLCAAHTSVEVSYHHILVV